MPKQVLVRTRDVISACGQILIVRAGQAEALAGDVVPEPLAEHLRYLEEQYQRLGTWARSLLEERLNLYMPTGLATLMIAMAGGEDKGRVVAAAMAKPETLAALPPGCWGPPPQLAPIFDAILKACSVEEVNAL